MDLPRTTEPIAVGIVNVAHIGVIAHATPPGWDDEGTHMGFEVEVRNVDGAVTALGAGGPHTLVVDRPPEAGGGGRGFNGGQLLHLAVAGCVSNDLFREAATRDLVLTRVVVRVDGGYAGEPAVSTGIRYSVEVEGQASDDDLRALVTHVDEIAEIPNSLRLGTEVTLDSAVVLGNP